MLEHSIRFLALALCIPSLRCALIFDKNPLVRNVHFASLILPIFLCCCKIHRFVDQFSSTLHPPLCGWFFRHNSELMTRKHEQTFSRMTFLLDCSLLESSLTLRSSRELVFYVSILMTPLLRNGFRIPNFFLLSFLFLFRVFIVVLLCSKICQFAGFRQVSIFCFVFS